MMKLAVGEIVQGYRIDRFLGRGGFASVYLAQHEETGEKVAIKVGQASGGGRQVTRLLEVTSRRTPDGISPDELPAEGVFFEQQGVRIDLFDEQEIRQLLLAEGELLAHAKHENLVGLRERLTIDGNPVLVMDYVRGKTLREKIRSLEGIHLNWFLALTRALLALKDQGAMSYHGDLKPENIIVKPSGSVVLLDPALRLDERCVTTTTPHYNPLLLRDSKADVMGIGVMLYEILTGVLPFDEVPWQYAGREQGGEVERLSLSYFLSYPPPREMNPNTPEALAKIVYKCLVVPEYGLAQLEADLVDFLRKE